MSLLLLEGLLPGAFRDVLGNVGKTLRLEDFLVCFWYVSRFFLKRLFFTMPIFGWDFFIIHTRVWRKIAQILNIRLNKLILVDDLWFPRRGSCTSPANWKRKHNIFRWYWSRVYSSQWPNQDNISCPPVATKQDLILVPCWFCHVNRRPVGSKSPHLKSFLQCGTAPKNRRPKHGNLLVSWGPTSTSLILTSCEGKHKNWWLCSVLASHGWFQFSLMVSGFCWWFTCFFSIISLVPTCVSLEIMQMFWCSTNT